MSEIQCPKCGHKLVKPDRAFSVPKHGKARIVMEQTPDYICIGCKTEFTKAEEKQA